MIWAGCDSSQGFCDFCHNKKLSADQITALFDGAAKIAAVHAALTED